MSNEAVRMKVLKFLRKKAEALTGNGFGGEFANSGNLIGDGRRRGRGVARKPRVARVVRVARVAKPRVHRVRKVAAHGGVRRRRVGHGGNMEALGAWHHFFNAYREKHPHMAYREAQHHASAAYKR